MTWFRVDDHLHAHRKSVRAGTEAMGLWVLAGSWSAAEESDGWVPAYMLPRLAGGGADELANALVRAGLWDADVVDGEDGYRFHQWNEHQPTRDQLEAKRADARERMRRARGQGGDVRANNASTSRSVTPTRPDPTRPKNKDTAASAADFDAFWHLYPRKVGKAAAERAFSKALRETDVATIAAAVHAAIAAWRADGTEPQYVPHPATWLNQGRWADELPAKPASAPTGATVTANQCDDQVPHERHRWDDGRNHFACMGVAA